jgi:glycosyltransferase involved in cell wall biosynthesis
MNIWIINHHALTPDMSGGTRHYDFAKELIKKGHSVTIIASSFHYSKFIEMKDYGSKDYLVENIDSINFIWFKTPSYIGNGVGRIKNMLNFSYKISSIIPSLKLKKPDIIIGSTVHLFAVYSAYRLSQTYKVPFVMEVRDLWPQTLIDMGISKWHPFIILLGILEKYLYKKADKIITLLPKANIYMEKLGINKDKIVWISNGTAYDGIVKSNEELLPKNKFNILYTGAIGLVNNIELFVKIANQLKNNDKYHFTIVGNGPQKENIQKISKEFNLTNITFIDAVAKQKIYSYLNEADLLYISSNNSSLYKYGVSQNKLYDYMASSKPVLYVGTIEDNIVQLANAGIIIEEHNEDKIAQKIIDISSLSQEEYNQYGKNGKEYIKNNFSIKYLSKKLEQLLKNEVTKYAKKII